MKNGRDIAFRPSPANCIKPRYAEIQIDFVPDQAARATGAALPAAPLRLGRRRSLLRTPPAFSYSLLSFPNRTATAASMRSDMSRSVRSSAATSLPSASSSDSLRLYSLIRPSRLEIFSHPHARDMSARARQL